MSEREQSFEEWSKTEEAIFNLCLKNKMSYSQHLAHVLKYKREWNYKI